MSPFNTILLGGGRDGMVIPLILCIFFTTPFISFGQSNTTVKMVDFIGINMRRQDPVHRMDCVGFAREYHEWVLDEGLWHKGSNSIHPNNAFRWNSSYHYQTTTHFDDFYHEISEEQNLLLCPDLMWAASYAIDPLKIISPNLYNTKYNIILDQKPIAYTYGGNPMEDPLDPFSYREHAVWMYHYAARYGNTSFSDYEENQLIKPRLHPVEFANTPYTGKGYIDFIESWNEPDKNWFINAGYPHTYFRPQEFAAMLSADYDGHMGTIRDTVPGTNAIFTVGVKNADPSIKFVMGGLAGVKYCYIDSMLTWWEENRTNPDYPVYPIDVINVHHYSNDYPDELNCDLSQLALGDVGISPEEDRLRQKLEALKTQIYQDHPNFPQSVEFWLSEFGYDTNPYSPQRVPEIHANGQSADRYEVQGQWLVRSYLEIAAAGYHRAMAFEIRDTESDLIYSNGQLMTGPLPYLYKSCGLLMDKGHDYQPKRSYYYVYTLKNILGNTIYAEDRSCPDQNDPNDPGDDTNSAEDNIRIYQFDDVDDQDRKVLAVWSPTAENRVIENYTIELGITDDTPAKLVKMQNKDKNGVEVPLAVTPQGEVFVDISERPVFIVIGEEATMPPSCVSDLTVFNENCSSLDLQWKVPQGVSEFNVYRSAPITGQPQTLDDIDNLILVGEHIASLASGELQTYTVPNLSANEQYSFIVTAGDQNGNFSDPCIINGSSSNNSCVIPVDSFEVINELAIFQQAIDPIRLFDEQHTVPVCSDGGQPWSEWGELWVGGTPENSISARIEFNQPYYLEGIHLFDGNGGASGFPFTVEYLDPASGDWIAIVEYEPLDYAKWKSFYDFQIDVPIEKVRITKPHAQSKINEVVFCGSPSNIPPDDDGGNDDPVVFEPAVAEITDASCTSATISWTPPPGVTPVSYKFVFDGQITNTLEEVITMDNLLAGHTYEFTIQYVSHAGDLIPSDPESYEATTFTGGAPDCGGCVCSMLELTPDMISLETPATVWGNGPENLVDEQMQAGNDICDSGNAVSTTWQEPWGSAAVVIDLGDSYEVYGFSMHDGSGQGEIQVMPGEPGAWEAPLFNYHTTAWNEWVTFEGLKAYTRYLKVHKANSASKINEIKVCVVAGIRGNSEGGVVDQDDNEEVENGLVIAPNPVDKQLNIRTAQTGYRTLELLDEAGRLIYKMPVVASRQFFNVDVSHLNTGIYLVRINGEKESITGKFVKQ